MVIHIYYWKQKTEKFMNFVINHKTYVSLLMDYSRQTAKFWKSQNTTYGSRYLWQRKENKKTHKIRWHGQPIGLKWFYSYSKRIANWCGLPDWWKYSGHSIRATSASFYVEGQKSLLQLKSFGGWKSDTVAESYYRDSVRNKNSDANVFNDVINVKEKDCMEEDDETDAQDDQVKDASKTEKRFTNCTFSNCTINFN
eukprot:206359_1